MTSREAYLLAENILRERKEWLDDAGLQPEERIRDAEERLGLTFPPTYRHFLLDHGSAIFAGEEVYGICVDIATETGIPCAVWMTLQKRQLIHLPLNLVRIYSVGEGTHFYLAIDGPEDDDCPVVSLRHKANGRFENHVEYLSFGQFWLSIVEQAVLDRLEENDEEE